jgi:alpha-tubulin suppressor-like RCC1 family protein
MRAIAQPAVILLLALAATMLWPRPEPVAASGATSVAAGYEHTCALTTDGGVKCWGLNHGGQLGNGTQDSAVPNPIPVDVLEEPDGSPLSGVSAISAGFGHTCAIVAATGGIKCWGKNANGQLGDGRRCGTVCTTPVDVPDLTSGVSAISSGANHTCAVTQAGDVKCWGLNHFGQLGAETAELCVFSLFHCSTTPVDVTGLNSAVVAIATGTEHTCAVTQSGGVKCWGKNYRGQLGDGTTTDSIDPVSVCQLYDEVGQSCIEPLSGAVAVVAGFGHTCALLQAEAPATSYGVKCWGSDTFGQLGDGRCCTTSLHSRMPVDVTGLASGVSVIAAGQNHTCAIIETSGSVTCWGLNAEGELGDGTTISPRSTPVDVVGLDSGMTALDGGGFHTCAVTEAAGVKCWGQNDDGQLGDGTTTNRTSPVDVLSLDPKPTPTLCPPEGCPAPTITPIPTATPTPTATTLGPAGDVDCNGAVNSIDAALILQYDAGLIVSLPCPENADANEDGAINSIDAALILQYGAGLIDGLQP